MKNIKHYFASANTGDGFVNHFNQINNKNKSGFTYVLKGGPGTGKSTLMRTIGEHFLKKNEEVEFFHCSSDVSSLDGVRLPKYNICMVDGTAPHVTEAQIPEINGRIVNVGEYISPNINRHKNIIEPLLIKKNKQFEILYSLIEIAGKISKLNNTLCEENEQEINQTIEEIFNHFPIIKKEGVGEERHLFEKAITKEDSSDLNNVYSKFIAISANQKTANICAKKIIEKCVNMGYNITIFHNLLIPSDVDSFVIDDIDLLITLNINNNVKNGYFKQLIDSNNKLINNLIKKAENAVFRAKKYHKIVEKYYISNVNFTKISTLTNKIISDIENRIIMSKN